MILVMLLALPQAAVQSYLREICERELTSFPMLQADSGDETMPYATRLATLLNCRMRELLELTLANCT
jgi:hypothetical protein